MIFLECKSDLVRSYENSCELNKDEAWNKDSQNPHKSGAGKMAICNLSIREAERNKRSLGNWMPRLSELCVHMTVPASVDNGSDRRNTECQLFPLLSAQTHM